MKITLPKITGLPRIATFFILGVGIASTSKILNDDRAFFDSLWPALVAICVGGYGLIEYHAKVHADKIEDGKYPSHWSSWLLRAAVTLLIVLLYHAYYFEPVKIADLCFFTAGWIGIVFNYKLNLFRGLPWDYVGLPDKKKDGMIEKIFRRWKHGGKLLLVLEVIWMGFWGWLYLR